MFSIFHRKPAEGVDSHPETQEIQPESVPFTAIIGAKAAIMAWERRKEESGFEYNRNRHKEAAELVMLGLREAFEALAAGRAWVEPTPAPPSVDPRVLPYPRGSSPGERWRTCIASLLRLGWNEDYLTRNYSSNPERVIALYQRQEPPPAELVALWKAPQPEPEPAKPDPRIEAQYELVAKHATGYERIMAQVEADKQKAMASLEALGWIRADLEQLYSHDPDQVVDLFLRQQAPQEAAV